MKGKAASRQSPLHEGAHRLRRPRTRASVGGRRSLLPAGNPEKLETELWRAQSSFLKIVIENEKDTSSSSPDPGNVKYKKKENNQPPKMDKSQ